MNIAALKQEIFPYLPGSLRRKLVPAQWNFSAADQRRVLRAPRGENRGENRGDASLFIGPANSASQGFLWARSVDAHTPFSARNLYQVPVEKSGGLPADVTVPKPVIYHSHAWSRRQSKEFLAPDGFTHFLIDSLYPIMGVKYRRNLVDEVHALQDAGKQVALMLYGTDVRTPQLHRELEPFSPFNTDLNGLTAELERKTALHHELADELNLPEFVTTLDLLAYRPGATWLPILRNRQRWPLTTQPKEHRSRPLVVHAPSNPLLKGSARIREAMGNLESKGLITYREITGIPADQVRATVADADIFIDQLQMGLHGVASLEAMSVGVPVVAEVGSRVRQEMRNLTGLEIPIAEANPDTIEDVVAQLAQDLELRERLGREGMEYGETVHSEQAAGQVLGKWMA